MQDNQTSNTSPPCRLNLGEGNADKGSMDSNVSCNENVANTARSPQFINQKRDPRQAAGRSQQLTASESKDGDNCQNGEKHTLPGLLSKEHLTEQINVEEKSSSVEKNSVFSRVIIQELHKSQHQ